MLQPFLSQAMRVREGTGPGGHPLPRHQRRRSNLTAEASSAVDEEEGTLEGAAAALEMEDESSRKVSTPSGMATRELRDGHPKTCSDPLSFTCCPNATSSPSCSSFAPEHPRRGPGPANSNSTVQPEDSRVSPSLLEMPTFPDDTEKSSILEQHVTRGTLGEEGAGTSESPSPSQRAALSSLYGLHAATSTLAEEKEEEVEGQLVQGRKAHVGEVRPADEGAEGVSAFVEQFLARHYISDRPELKRYDSADAALEVARSGEKGARSGAGSHSRQSSASTISSHLKSELPLQDAVPPPAPSVLQAPPRLHGRRRSSEGFVEIQVANAPSSGPAYTQEEAPEGWETGHSQALSTGAIEEEEEEKGPRLALPQFSRFDSGDYFMQKDARARANEPPVLEKSGAAEPGVNGHRTAANFLLRRGERTDKSSR